MNQLYWIGEFCKVLVTYVLLLYIAPLFLFHGYLRGKGVRCRFAFCAAAQILLIYGATLCLGFLHVLRPWLVRILFYGIIILCGLRRIRMDPENIDALFRLIGKKGGMHVFFYQLRKRARNRLRDRLHNAWRAIRPRMIEYAVLLVLLLYAVLYFSWGVLEQHSYGACEMYMHHEQISCLTEGALWSGGAFPGGMHCFVYALHVLFGVRIYSILLYLPGIHVATLLLAVYCFLRSALQSRFTPFAILTVFLVLRQSSWDTVSAMSRLQWALPTEFGLPIAFLCASALLEYLRGRCSGAACPPSEKVQKLSPQRKHRWAPKWCGRSFGSLRRLVSGLLRNDAQLLFLLSLAGCMSIHYHVALLAVPLCLAAVVSHPSAVFKLFRPGGAVKAGNNRRPRPKRSKAWRWNGYLFLLAGTVLLAVLYAVSLLEVSAFPSPADARLTVYITILSALFIPLDLGLVMLERGLQAGWLTFLPAAETAVIWASIILLGAYHGNLYSQLTRYNEAADLSNTAIENCPAGSFMVLGCPEDLLQIAEYGYHERLAVFLEEVEQEGSVTLPSEYIFIFLEKQPLAYAQFHFHSAPDWLVNSENTLFPSDEVYSYGAEAVHGVISEDLALMDNDVGLAISEVDVYRDLNSRSILMSRGYQWCQRFMEFYPDEMRTVFENERFICYSFQQSMMNPFNLAFSYRSDGEELGEVTKP